MDKPDVFESLQRLMRLTRRYWGKGRRRSSNSHPMLMRILRDNDGISAKELVERMDIRASSLSETLERMEKRGEIERTRDEKDSRVYRIYLTEHGINEMEKRSEEYAKSQQEIESCLTEDEKEVFIEICGKLSKRLAKMADNAKSKKEGDS
jgi:Transcriptional regulators